MKVAAAFRASLPRVERQSTYRMEPSVPSDMFQNESEERSAKANVAQMSHHTGD